MLFLYKKYEYSIQYLNCKVICFKNLQVYGAKLINKYTRAVASREQGAFPLPQDPACPQRRLGKFFKIVYYCWIK